MKQERMQKLGSKALWVARGLQLVLLAGFVWSAVNLARFWDVTGTRGFATGGLSMLKMAGMFFVFVLLAALVKSMKKEDGPFTLRNARLLKWMALTLTVLGAVQLVADLALSLGGWVQHEAGGQQVLVQHMVFDLSTLMFLGLAVVLFAVALVFEYGAVLQRQSDETL